MEIEEKKRRIAVGMGIILILFFVAWWTPSQVILPVPFTAQAPTDNWTNNKDCEEASITMAYAYLTGNTTENIPATIALGAIATLKRWEQSTIGYDADTGADETSRMAKEAFGLNVRQIHDYTENDLKRAIANRQVVLLPINARLLGNPQYKDTGPTYHMVVVRGYSDAGFIVNDPGTDAGNGNVYTFETLQKAAADWNNVTQMMEPARKIALVISR